MTDDVRLHDEGDEQEQLELYVLNLLDDDEMAATERLIAADPVARDRVRQLRAAASLLAHDLEPMAPAPSVKNRLMAAARADLALGSSVSPAPFLNDTSGLVSRPESSSEPILLADARNSREMSSGSRWTPWAIAAILTIALAGSLLWNANLRGELDERIAATAHEVETSGNAASANGEVVVLDDDGVALLTLSGLPTLELGQVYQVWLIADGDPQPNVTFSPSNQGFANVAITGPVVDYRILAVTVEPDGGSATPTTEPTIISELTESSEG